LGIKVNLSTAYHPQTDGQTERVNQVLEQYLRIYSNYHQNDWSIHLPLAEFTFNNSINQSTKFSPFFAHHGYHPRSDAFSTLAPHSPDLLDVISETVDDLKSNLVKAQERYKLAADRRRLDREFQVGDMVWLSTRNLSSRRPSRKLDYRRLGPFPIIERIGPVAYRLRLPGDLLIHNVFHVSLLEPAPTNPFPSRIVPPPPPVEVDGELEYVVEEILDSRRRGRGLQYLVRWLNYPLSEATWEPSSNVVNAADLVAAFHQRFPSKPGPRRVSFEGGVM
jgi:hypothetical protein